MNSPAQPPPAPELKPVDVRYEHSQGLPALVEQLELSVLLSTYQAGRVVSVGSHHGELRLGFAHFDQAMGLCRTASGIAVGTRDAIWSLPANREIAGRIKPEGEHDIAFLAPFLLPKRPADGPRPGLGQRPPLVGEHPVLRHGDDRGRLELCAPVAAALHQRLRGWRSLPPQRPGAGRRRQRAGLRHRPGETETENGWREHKATGGCLIHVLSGEVVLRRLSMPHAPRLYQGQLYLLDSGHGALVRMDTLSGQRSTVANLPGFTRGLDCFAGYAFVGLSQIHETAVFGGLAVGERQQELKCGLAVVNLSSGSVDGLLWFHSGIEEVFAVVVLPGWRNPAVIGPYTSTDASQTVWLVPPLAG